MHLPGFRLNKMSFFWKLLADVKETPSKHIFSKHDNRHAFPGSATYFESGLGRRRIEGSLPNTHNLIDWVPLKDELQRDRPLMSSYQSDFRSENKVPQLLIHHAQLQEQPLQRTPSTTYQRTYRSYLLREPARRLFQQQELAEESEAKEADSSAPTVAEPTAPDSGETAATNASPATEGLAAGPLYKRSKQRWTVSDCLHWHNC